MRPAAFPCRFSRRGGRAGVVGFEGTASSVGGRRVVSYFSGNEPTPVGRRVVAARRGGPARRRVGRYMPCEGASSDRGDAVSVAACAVRLDGRAGCGGAGADCSQCAPVVGCARPVAVVGALRALAVKWPLSTRLETRTKESSMRASLGVRKPVGAMKVNVLSRVRAVAVRGVGASSTDLVRSR